MSDPSPTVKVLLVDDEPANLVALEAVLAPLGQELVLARSGREALRRLLKEEFAVILLDIRMADLDGFEVAELIRGRPATQSIPIIFLTAFGEAEENMERAYAIGAADFIFKPFVPEFLRAKVEVFVELAQKQRSIAELLERAQAAGRSKSEFLNMAAHELRTPLSVVSGYLSMLGDGTFGPPPPEWGRVLDILNRKSSELNKIVDDLLTASRLESGSVAPSPIEFDLCALVRENVERLGERPDGMQAEVTIDLPAGPVLVRADPGHVGRVLDNLVANALAYSTGRPWVRVSVRGGDETLLTVEDKGVGIAADMREQIFERFVRLNDPELAPQPGTGLGLFISRELARRNAGRLFVADSEPGRGSTLALGLRGLGHQVPSPQALVTSPS